MEANGLDPISIDVALYIVGSYHQYQIRLTVLFSLLILVISYVAMSPTYLYAIPDIHCAGQPCEATCQSADATYTSIPTQNVAIEMRMFCENAIHTPLIVGTFFFGGFSSGIYIGYIADYLGRKIGMTISILICLLGSIIYVRAYSLLLFILSNYLLGAGCFGSLNLTFIIINECFSKTSRQQTVIVMLILWAVSQIITAALHFYFHNWRMVYFGAVSIPLFICFLCTLIFVKETPKYYYARQNMDKCCEVLNEIATINNREHIMLEDLISHEQFEVPTTKQQQYNLLDLFKYKLIRLATIGFSIVSMTIDILYYGCQFSLNSIAKNDNLYITGVSVALSEIFWTCIAYAYVSQLYRVTSIQLSLASSIIMCFSVYYANSLDIPMINTILALLQRSCITLASIIMSFHPFEFYPTVVRSIGSGFIRSVGLVGSMLAPFLIHWAQQLGINPYFLLGLVSLAGPFAILMVQETRNQPLRDQLDEVENIRQ